MTANSHQALWYAAFAVGAVVFAGYTASIPLEPRVSGPPTGLRVLFAGISAMFVLAALAHGVLAFALFTGWVDSVERSGTTAVLRKNGEQIAQGKVRLVVKLADGIGGDQPDSACVLFFCGRRPYVCRVHSFMHLP